MSHRFWKFDPANAGRLVSSARADVHPPEHVLSLLDPRRGHVVADVGCGPGYFTIPIAERVQPAGRVAALDIAPEMLARLRARAAATGVRNVVLVQSEESRLPLAAATYDRVLLAFLIHELETPDEVLLDVRHALRPGGLGVVIDWMPRETPAGPPLEVRVPAERVRERLETAGLASQAPVDLGPHSYAVVFRRP
ncbi:MAG TPA: methyltransferase domain-containing protein [bacterium]|nr:methyltransferase domain-containing protein [bacterium]